MGSVRRSTAALGRWLFGRGIECLGDILSPPDCPACGRPRRSQAVFCSPCASLVILEPAWEAGVFSTVTWGGPVKDALVRLKYGRDVGVARPLGHLLRAGLADAGLEVDRVLPVPLHPRRLAVRGFNQCTLLARAVSAQLGAPLDTGRLARIVETAPQAGKSAVARRAAMQGAFRARGVAGSTLALVDDVVTTGTTLRAAADALLEAGARRVVSIALARATQGA